MIPAGIGFWYGGARRELRAAALRAVIPRVHATRVPGAPSRVLGVMAWGGAMIALIRPAEAMAEVICAVVVDIDGVLVGLGAERIEGYVEVIDPTAVMNLTELLGGVTALCRAGRR